jgi:maltose-binding protein MalE
MRMQRSLVLFAVVAVVALIAVASMPASQQASAHHKVHTASTQVSTTTVAVHHKAHTASVHQVVSDTPIVKGKIVTLGIKAVDPQAHNSPDKTLQNATAMKALTKGPYGETDVIGGMMSGGY